MAKSLKILGIDPGTSFSGYSIIQVTPKSVHWQYSGLFRNLLKTVDKNIESNIKPFMREIRGILKKHSPDIVIMESFMARMTHQSNLGAPISIMIGIVSHMCFRRGIRFSVVMPNTWKRKLKKDFRDVDQIYDMSYPVKQRLPNHILDSFFQALYASGDKCYDTLSPSLVDNIKIKMKGSTSLLKDVDFVNNFEKERLKLRRSKKKPKAKKPKQSKKKP